MCISVLNKPRTPMTLLACMIFFRERRSIGKEQQILHRSSDRRRYDGNPRLLDFMLTKIMYILVVCFDHPVVCNYYHYLLKLAFMSYMAFLLYKQP